MPQIDNNTIVTTKTIESAARYILLKSIFNHIPYFFKSIPISTPKIALTFTPVFDPDFDYYPAVMRFAPWP